MRRLVVLSSLLALAFVGLPRAHAVHTGLYAFRHLGAWVDQYDTALDPAVGAAEMKSRGVRTVYLQTGRYTLDADIANPSWVGRWIDEAYRRGLKIVGWYLPGYADLERDVRRTVAIATFKSPRGHRFHAIGVDIEDRKEVGYDLDRFNDGVARHLSRVRYRLTRIFGTSAYPVGAIVPAPLGMAVAPNSWKGFPWAAVGRWANVVLPMAYWSYRKDCPEVPKHCPYYYLKYNTQEARRLTGLRVHAIGGVGDSVTDRQVLAGVRGTIAARAYGGSLYDFRTTTAGFWSSLRQLNDL